MKVDCDELKLHSVSPRANTRGRASKPMDRMEYSKTNQNKNRKLHPKEVMKGEKRIREWIGQMQNSQVVL